MCVEDSDYIGGTKSVEFKVLAYTADDACNWAYARMAAIPCTEIKVYGIRGGIAKHRYIGYDSANGNAIFGDKATKESFFKKQTLESIFELNEKNV